MIFVTLGNQNFPFQRLLLKIEDLINTGQIKEKVVAQIGHTDFSSDKMSTVDFMSKEVFEQHIDDSSFVITHSGTGSIVGCLSLGKKAIVAARYKEYGEHIDDHQQEILDVFVKKGLVIGLNKNLSDLEEKIKNIEKAELNKFKSNNSSFNRRLSDLILDLS